MSRRRVLRIAEMDEGLVLALDAATTEHLSANPRAASAIEARRAETQGGSVADKSAVANGETPTPSSAQPGDA